MFSIEGIFVNSDREFEGRVEVDTKSGLITNITSATGNADVICNKSELIFSGFIDLHVHAREDASGKQNYKEDFTSASAAAINGGVTHFCDMPNNPIAPVTDEKYLTKKQLANKAPIEITLYAGIGPGTSPLSAKVPYKAYMGPSVGDLFFHSQPELEETIKKYEGQYISFHCEDPEILEQNKNQPTHEMQRPKAAEITATDFALHLIEKYHLHGKLCHYSTKEGLHKITAAKKRGVNATCEVTPHHLYFDQTMLTNENHNWLQMNPPLRSKEDRLAMIEGLRNGDIDYLATDHAPHTREEKLQGMSGVPLLDTYGGFCAWLIKEQNFKPEDIARVCGSNPGTFVNIFNQNKSGKIEVGYVGSFAVLNFSEPWLVKKENLKTKCGWSPFENINFPGRVSRTIVKGIQS